MSKSYNTERTKQTRHIAKIKEQITHSTKTEHKTKNANQTTKSKLQIPTNQGRITNNKEHIKHAYEQTTNNN